MATFMYVSLQQEDRIAQYTVDPATGALEHHADYPLAGMPAPMAVDPQQRFLFVGRRLAGEYGLTGFAIQPENGHLRATNSVPPQRRSRARLRRPAAEITLLSAYYYQAPRRRPTVSTTPDPSNRPPIEWRENRHRRPLHPDRPKTRYAPSCPTSPRATTTGVNAIFQFQFDQDSGRSPPTTRTRRTPTPLEGPPPFLLQPQPQRPLFVKRTGMQRHGVQLRPGGRRPLALPDRSHAARRFRRTKLLLPDPDHPVRPVPLRAQSRPQQHRRFRRQPIRRQPDPSRPDLHRDRPKPGWKIGS